MQLQSLLTLLTLAAASPVVPQAPKVVKFDTTMRPGVAHGLERRGVIQDHLSQPSGNYITIPMYFGSEKEEYHVMADTGSYDSWITVNNNYTLEGSTTGTNLSTPMHIGYGGGGVSVVGYFVNDTVSNSADGDSVYLTFGLATGGPSIKDGRQHGLLGIGANANPERGFVNSMINAGMIEVNALSLWLANKSTGHIIFGGVDVSKMATGFTKLPRAGGSGVYVQKFTAILNGEEVVLGEGNKHECIFDSGNPNMYFPEEIFDAVLSAYDAVLLSESQEAQDAGLPVYPGYYAIKYQGPSSIKYSSCGFDFEIPLYRHLVKKDFTTYYDSEPEIGEWCIVMAGHLADYCLMGTSNIFLEYVIALDYDNNYISLAKAVDAKEAVGKDSVFSEFGKEGPSGTLAPHTELVSASSAFTAYTTAKFTATA